MAVAALGAGLVDQSLALIETDRLDADAGLARELPDGPANCHASLRKTGLAAVPGYGVLGAGDMHPSTRPLSIAKRLAAPILTPRKAEAGAAGP